MFDSVTRFARAQREIGLAIGEPSATRGYPPSVFDLLPKLLERSGPSDKGSITGVYTILVEGDDMDEPISDAVRAVLDGHIVLSRKMAERFQYPAIDVLKSISRLTNILSGPETQKMIGIIRRLISVYEESEVMISIGAYVKGSNPAIDEAIEKREAILNFLKQNINEKINIVECIKQLAKIAGIEIPASELAFQGKEPVAIPETIDLILEETA
jgi:flagellum-specific ATP synthase